jgi:DNA-binding NtrC family response regulator
VANEVTLTNTAFGPTDDAEADRRDHLVLLAMAEEPATPSSRHVLDGVDEVRFGRGERSATRRTANGVRVLELRVPDPRMSTEHGRLLRTGNGWVLDDPSSKNGAVVDGEPTRKAAIDDGALLELGRTFFLFARGAVAEADRADVVANQLATPHPVLATFDGPLAQSFAALARVAPNTLPVVLLGETGTGKEVVARALHELSRRSGDFIGVNCGGLPEDLIENELFGHRKGAYSGAQGERAGLVRSADGGTLFLDEIGELPASSQTAFLRVLQESEVTPIGADRPVKVDLRVCAATLRDLEEMVELGGFRRDLYARLFGYTLVLPPLRERRADLGMLIAALLARIGGEPVKFTPSAMRALLRHPWPLNVRELERVLATAVALSPDRTIDVPHLSEPLRRTPSRNQPPVAADADPDEPTSELKAQLLALLREHEGKVAVVAAKMGKRRMQIYRWIKRLDIDLSTLRN